MITPPATQALRDAERNAADGDFLKAVAFYESALDDSPAAADVHYRLALLYDDKMNDPLNALHHCKRYLTLAPSGKHLAEVKELMKRDELALVTTLSGDSIVTRAEAARLKNENLALRKDLDQLRGVRAPGVATAVRSPAVAAPGKQNRGTYVVESGDTLVSISRKIYKTPKRWKEIRAANSKVIEDPGKLRVGQTLTLP